MCCDYIKVQHNMLAHKSRGAALPEPRPLPSDCSEICRRSGPHCMWDAGSIVLQGISSGLWPSGTGWRVIGSTAERAAARL